MKRESKKLRDQSKAVIKKAVTKFWKKLNLLALKNRKNIVHIPRKVNRRKLGKMKMVMSITTVSKIFKTKARIILMTVVTQISKMQVELTRKKTAKLMRKRPVKTMKKMQAKLTKKKAKLMNKAILTRKMQA